MPTLVCSPGVTGTPSTVAITLSVLPTLVMVLAAVMVTVNLCVSPCACPLTVKVVFVSGVPSYVFEPLSAVMVMGMVGGNVALTTASFAGMVNL